MGSASWVAARGISAEELYSRLGLTITGQEKTDLPHEHILLGGPMRLGWHIVIQNDSLAEISTPSVPERCMLHELSMGAEVWATVASTTAMCCETSLWRNGTKVFQIAHNGQVGRENIETTGDHRLDRVDILQAWARQKNAGAAGVDYMYEVPLLVAWREVGFSTERGLRHPLVFDTLEASGVQPRAVPSTSNKPWWKFW